MRDFYLGGANVDALFQKILEKDLEYNAGDMAMELFGLRSDVHYDLLVAAPGWKPQTFIWPEDTDVLFSSLHSYVSGYDLTMGRRRVGWIQTASSAANVLDHLTVCAQLHFDKLVFIGAVGGIDPDFALGDVCTPSCCIDGSFASAYLLEDPRSHRPFETVTPHCPEFISRVTDEAAARGIRIRKGKVFCTDSICCEYYHLPFIRSFGSELVEMETALFYRLVALLEKPSIALLVVSDNSTNGHPLLGRSPEQEALYKQSRAYAIPTLLRMLAEMEL